MTAPTARSRRVAVLASMRLELRPLVRPLCLGRADAGGLRSGAIGRTEVVATTTGIGPRAAARTSERLLDLIPVDHVVVVAIAGGIGPSVAVGDLVVPELVLDLAAGTEHRPSRLGGPAAARNARDVGWAARRSGCDRPARKAGQRRHRHGDECDRDGLRAPAPPMVRLPCDQRPRRRRLDRPGGLRSGGARRRTRLPTLARFLLFRPWRIPQLVRLGRDSKLAAHTAAAAAVHAVESA